MGQRQETVGATQGMRVRRVKFPAELLLEHQLQLYHRGQNDYKICFSKRIVLVQISL